MPTSNKLSCYFFFFLTLTWVKPSLSLPSDFTVNHTRIIHELHELAKHNDLTPPSVQRILYTSSDMSARAYISDLMHTAGLQTHTDAVGNLFGVWPGVDKDSPGILTGSHIDAIPHSGMFDGTLGVIGAIEAVRALRAASFQPMRNITVISFTAEEPTRFGLSCIGSRALSGASSPKDLSLLRDGDGVSFDEARTSAGFRGSVADVELSPQNFDAFVELHIEQADRLERSGIAIGAVTAIAAPAGLEIRLRGPGGHAGSLLMHDRHDALTAAAEIVLAVESAALGTKANDTVGTVGSLRVFPGASNSVPREVEMSVDVRDVDAARRDVVMQKVRDAVDEVGKRRGVQTEVVETNRDDPAVSAEKIVKGVEEAAAKEGLQSMRLVSRAYHDSTFMAKKMRMGMIFVPCRDGVSHRPDEMVEDVDVKNGAVVLARILARLAGDSNSDRDSDRGREGEQNAFPSMEAKSDL